MNYKDCCRTCLGKTKEMRHINSSITISGHDVRLTDILYNFYNYQVILAYYITRNAIKLYTCSLLQKS